MYITRYVPFYYIVQQPTHIHTHTHTNVHPPALYIRKSPPTNHPSRSRSLPFPSKCTYTVWRRWRRSRLLACLHACMHATHVQIKCMFTYVPPRSPLCRSCKQRVRREAWEGPTQSITTVTPPAGVVFFSLLFLLLLVLVLCKGKVRRQGESGLGVFWVLWEGVVLTMF